MYRLLPILLLAACSASGTEDVLARYDGGLADLDALVTAHTTAVSAATTLEEVGPLEAAYETEWADLSATMHDHLHEIADCEMNDTDMATMESVERMLEDMNGVVEAHVASQADHTDISACATEEDAHLAAWEDRATSMREHGDSWTDMRCSVPMDM